MQEPSTDPVEVAVEDGGDAPEKDVKGDVLKEAKERWKFAEGAWSDNYTAWRNDQRFRLGDHWPDKMKADREAKELPCLVVDKLEQYVRQVVNDGRQNRPGIKIRPVDDKGDVETADAFVGLVRNICAYSNLDEATDTALEHAAGNGFGFFRVLTEYEHEKSFNQDIIIRRIRNPLAVLIDPQIQLADGSDMRFGFVAEELPLDELKRQYPKAKFTDWTSDQAAYVDGWGSEKAVRVAEYFRKVYVDGDLLLLADGTVQDSAEYDAAAKKGVKLPPVVKRRKAMLCKVMWAKLTGAEVLEEREWAGKYIPIIPVFGNEADLDGKLHLSGLVRPAKDAQRLYDYSRSKFAERVAITTMAPWLVAEESVGEHKEWEEANVGNRATLTYRAFNDEGQAIPKPERISPSDVPQGFAQDMQISEHDIQASLGMYSASVGAPSNEKSGRAIMARQREGDTSTFHYQDNLNRAIRYLGRILVDLVPKVLDTRRVSRILGEDGTATQVMIDPDHQGKPKQVRGMLVFNPGAGRYDVDVAAGPSYTTKRQESAEAMMEIAKVNPGMWETHGDLIVDAQDWPDSEKFAKRSKLVMPAELREAVEASESGNEIDQKVAAIKAQARQDIDEREQAIQQAHGVIAQLEQENAALKAGTAVKGAEVDVKRDEADTKQYQAETDRMTAVAPAIDPMMVKMIVDQTVAAILAAPGAEPMPDAGMMPLPQPHGAQPLAPPEFQ